MANFFFQEELTIKVSSELFYLHKIMSMITNLSSTELRKRKAREEKERKLVQDLLNKKITTHYKARMSPYPGTKIMRFPISDEKVLWEVCQFINISLLW